MSTDRDLFREECLNPALEENFADDPVETASFVMRNLVIRMADIFEKWPASVWIVVGKDGHVEVLKEQPRWDWDRLAQSVYVANVNGGDALRVPGLIEKSLVYEYPESDYPFGPGSVGSVDGTEDDFGDLISECWDLFGGPEIEEAKQFPSLDNEAWQAFQDAATNSGAVEWKPWIDELAESLLRYR